jgi:RHS repeat-associated protein
MKNDFLYQGQELQDDLDIGWYQFKWRMHDPAIGRFVAIYPLAEDYFYNSPYAFSENKVTSHIELEGLEAVAVTNMASEFDGTPYEWGGKVPAFQGGLPQGMTHQWYMENIGNPSSEAGGALWFNPNYSNEVNLSQYLSGSQNSCGIDCSGLAGTSFNADQEKLMGDFDILNEGVSAMRNAFVAAEENNTGFLGTDFNNVSEGDLILSGGHVRVSTGQTRTNESGQLEVEFWHAPETGEYVERTWQVPGTNWSFGHTFRENETILNTTTIEEDTEANLL